MWLMIEIGETGRRLKGQIEKARPLCLIARLVERDICLGDEICAMQLDRNVRN